MKYKHNSLTNCPASSSACSTHSIMNKTISIVIGSWGSYNECKERALVSTCIDLADYDSYEKIKQELIMLDYDIENEKRKNNKYLTKEQLVSYL